MAKAFPKTLYVKRETEGDTGYFLADGDRDMFAVIGERERVAVYELKETQVIEGTVVTRERH